jgi:rRNA maturation RNase YbeY
VRSHFHVIENHQKRVQVSLPELERFFLRMNREMGLGGESAFVRLVSDAEMRRLNTRYRNKPKTTDVLSFPVEGRTRPKALRVRTKQLRGAFLGDIAISPVVARRNARLFGRSTSQEICVLMERVEAKLRRRLGLS